MMVDTSGEFDCHPTRRQAWERMTEFLPITLFILILASLSAATPIAAQESNACDQYGCAEELNPSGGEDPVVEESPADELSSPVESEIPPEESAGAEEPASPTNDLEESGPEGGPKIEHSEIAPMSEPVSESARAGAIASPGKERAEGSVEGNSRDIAAEKPDKENVGSQKYYGNEKTYADGSGENTSKPLPGYPYSGEACEESHCGLAAVEKHLRCAAYQIASSKKVYGCTDPRTFDRKSCYEITFYTKTGEPYSNLDTCSGEKPYAPPEPPNGEFNYFEPPANPYSVADWDGHSIDQCYFDKKGEWVEPPEGLLYPHCGLENLPKRWNCEVYYDTTYGTVRGCHEGIEMYGENHFCSRPLHLYDEAGREIGSVPSCPEVRSEKCGASQCGAPVPSDWTCRREHWSFGKLYGGETRTLRRCANPEFYEYTNDERPPCKRRNVKPISALYDEKGEKVDGMTCLPGGSGGDLGEWAGLEAKQADDTLKGTKRRATTGSPDDRRTLTDSENWSEQPSAPSAPDSPVTEPGVGEPEPEELDFFALSGEDGTGSAWRSAATPVADGGQSGPEFAGDSLTSSRHSSVDQVPPENEDSDKNRTREPVLGYPGVSEAASASAAFATGKRENLGYTPPPDRQRGYVSDPMVVTGGALPEKQDIQVPAEVIPDKDGPFESANSSVSAPAAEPVASFFGNGDRAEASAPSGTATSRASAGEWLGRLVPLSWLAAVVGMFVLRRRFFV